MNLLNIVEYLIAFTTITATIFLTLVFWLNEDRMKDKKPSGILPMVTVLVPAYNEEESVAGTLDSLLALDYPKEKIEIIVLNDGSTDGTAGVVERYKKRGVALVVKKNTGKADTLNQGIKLAKGDIIVTMDADSQVMPDVLKNVVGHFDDPKVGAVASSVFVKSAPNFVTKIQRVEYLFTIFSRRVLGFINCVTVTPGPFSAFRKSALLEVGGYDPESLVEDQEVALNLQMHGYRIETSPDVKVFSDVPKTWGELMNQRVRWQRGGFYNALKYRCAVGIKQGDLGIVIMPYTIWGYLVLTIVPFLVLWSFYSGSLYGGVLGWEGFRLSFGTVHVLAGIMIFFMFLWLYFGMKEYFENEKLDMVSIWFFILVYPMLLTIVWLFAAYKEATKQTKRW